MKLLIAVLTLVSAQAFASTSTFTCNADFIVPKEGGGEDDLTSLPIKLVINEKGGKATMTITQGKDVFIENKEFQTYSDNKPKVEMAEQILELSQENAAFGTIAKKLWGNLPERIVKETAVTTFAGFEEDDTGAILGYHYAADKSLIAVELSIGWMGTSICK